MKKLRVFLLAALVLALSAVSAFAATWTGAAPNPTDQTKWGVAANWADNAVPEDEEEIIFPSNAVVSINDPVTVGTMRVTGANSTVTIMLGTAGVLSFADGAEITFTDEEDVAATGASLEFRGSGYIMFADTGPTLVPSSSSTMAFNATIGTTTEATSVPTIAGMPQQSRIAFTGAINPNRIGTGRDKWPGDIAWVVDDSTATLSVNRNSQVKAVDGLVTITLSGTLEVAGNIDTSAGDTIINLEGAPEATGVGDPKINVLADCTFTARGGADSPIFVTEDAVNDYKITKLGAGRLNIVGGSGENGLGSNAAEVFLQAGDLVFTRGGRAAFAPANEEAAHRQTTFYANGGHLIFGAGRSVETRSDPSQRFAIELRLTGNGTVATVNNRSIGNSTTDLEQLVATLEGERQYNPEVYPGGGAVNFPFPTRALIGTGATLEVSGTQAFQKISGMSRLNVGAITIAKGAQLILTHQGSEYVDNLDADCYFYGSVSGEGGVAFANRELIAGSDNPVMEQIYPFVGKDADGKTLNTYTGDTVVYGTVPEGVLLLCENSELPATSALYLRSVYADSNVRSPSGMVGSLRAIRLAGPSRNVNGVHLLHVKVDGANQSSSAAFIDIAPYPPNSAMARGRRGVPEDNDDFWTYFRNQDDYPNVLIVDKFSYHVNSGGKGANDVFSLFKRGPGTLFVNGATSVGGNRAAPEAVTVEEGMLWLYNDAPKSGDTPIGENQINVKKGATLRVANGSELPANLIFEDETSNFVTEVDGSDETNNRNNMPNSVYAVKVNGAITHGSDSIYGGVDLGGVIVWDKEFKAGYGYKVLEFTEGSLHDKFDAQTVTENHGVRRPFLTGWMEKPGQGLMFGSHYDVTTVALDGTFTPDAAYPVAANSFFQGRVKILHGTPTTPIAHLLVGGMGSIGATVEGDEIVVRGNINPNPKEDYVIFTIYLPAPAATNANAPKRFLGTQRTYKVPFTSGGGVTPPVESEDVPVPTTVTSTSTVAIDKASLTASDDLVLRMAATDAGIDGGKIVQLKDADGNMVPVSNAVVLIGNTEITNYTAEMIGGAYQIRIPASSVPTGTNAVSLRGTLADGRTIVTPNAGSVTKTSSGGGGSDSGGGGSDSGGGGSDSGGGGSDSGGGGSDSGDGGGSGDGDDGNSGGSSGGCDAGFGALSMAIAAAFLLRKKN